MADSEFLAADELIGLGFKSVGRNSQISRKCSFYVITGHIGDDVRVDDFCILKGHLNIGSNIHIGAFSSISGAQAQVTIGDFCVLSVRTSIFTGSNDHAADVLSAPLAPAEYTKQKIGEVSIGPGVMIGAHCVILPDVAIGVGASIGAGCVIGKDIYSGEMIRSAQPVTLQRKRDFTKILDFIRRAGEKKHEGV